MGKHSTCCYECSNRTITCKITCPEWAKHESEKAEEYKRKLSGATLTQYFKDSANRKDKHYRHHNNLPR